MEKLLAGIGASSNRPLAVLHFCKALSLTDCHWITEEGSDASWARCNLMENRFDSMVASIASMFIWRIGFSHVLGIGLGWGAYGVWTAMVVDWVCRIICFSVRYRRGKWVKLAHLTAA
ncbi:MAG: hypothetical protein IJU61_16195 [Victivallales bacterium]|nr:hypothetical protein [Victivallales bacterium]